MRPKGALLGVRGRMAFVTPYVRDVLDTPDPQNLLPKGIVVVLGAVVFLLCNALAYQKGCGHFEVQGLSV
ncbi:MAG: hypothetical protein VB030_03680 [Eubacterium aggregans]|uniref:hypothetical protein n=2 Tax=Eubacterium aggregans TaxID=81409 RepID=UPI0011600707|nr:hypothetical protein [Eubacterium aggregans]MDD4692397.1 hypothetical protein [Eubacterium aggregans]MEA5073253.1 hypothetical protein [Eubacterium aggregans]